MVGAGPVTDELEVSFRERFGRTLVRGYGSTETGGTFLGTRGLGAPVSGVEILRPSPGEQGELVLRLAAPVEGYLDDTAEPSRTWSTGDAVRRDRDGVVHFVSRLRGGLRLNGRFIDTDVAEQALRSTPGVRDVLFLVLPRRHTPEIEDLYAVVEGDHGRCDTVLEQLARRAPEVPLPHVVGCARVPRNVLGKPDRYQLIDAIRKEYPVA
jgi:acyl-coenzyme A synthetase/AMP-(fatty) acid ligase